MKVPISYNLRNLWRRRLTTTLTIGGIALVVFAFAAVLMLAHGLEVTLVATGTKGNVIVLRKGSSSEMLSIVTREDAGVIKSLPEVALTGDNKPLAVTEVVVIINLMKIGSNDMGNINARGTTAEALLLRPNINFIEGHMFQPGSTEIIVGKSIAQRFQGCQLNNKLKFGKQYWTIVGIFEDGGTGFESEVWGDVEQLMPAFGRPVYSTTTIRLKSGAQFESFQQHFITDLRLKSFEPKEELKYYAEQSQFLATFIRVLGLVITIIFSIGSVIGAMITMYTAVANRTKEIGTLRALGFKKFTILFAFIIESFIISFLGGILGLVLASFLQFFTISTINWNTFSELAFGFQLSPSIIIFTMLFAVLMGLGGGLFPAVRAARLKIVDSLRGS